MLALRDLTEGDDLDVLMEGQLGWPGAQTWWDLNRGTPPEVPHGAWVACDAGVPVGWGWTVAAAITRGDRAIGGVHVVRAHRRRGAGRLLLDRVRGLIAEQGVRGLLTQADVADAGSLVAAERLGGVRAEVHFESHLALDRVADEVVDAAIARVAPIVLEQPADTDEVWHELHRATEHWYLDTPDAGGDGMGPPYTVFRAMAPESWMVLAARLDGELVGITYVMRRGSEGTRLNTAFTGVARGQRRRGLASALKGEHARRLAARGYRTLSTQNQDGNVGVLTANERLGFERFGATVELLFDGPAR